MVCVLSLPVAAHADAGDFLKGLEGSYTGRGTAVVGLGKKTQRVSCKIENSFSEGKKALDVKGNCASTQGKRRVSGRINYSGNSVSGALLTAARGYKVTKSTGSVNGNQMTISINMMDDRVNKLVRGRQVLVKTGNGFKSTVYRYDNKTKKYEAVGEMEFTKK